MRLHVQLQVTTSILFMIAAVRIHFKLTKGLVYTRLQINLVNIFLCVQRKNVYMQDTIFVTYQQILQADITICFPIKMHNIFQANDYIHIYM